MATLRELVIKVRTSFEGRGLSQANRAVDRTKRRANDAVSAVNKLRGAFQALAGLAIVNQIKNTTLAMVALGDSTAKAARFLGLSSDALQELEFAAGRTGVATNVLHTALQRLNRRAAEAAQGTGESKAAFQELGIQLKDSTGQLRPVEELLGDIADGLQGVATEGDRGRLAMKFFDTEGAKLADTLKGGSAELNRMRKEARNLGGLLSSEFLTDAEAVTDQLQDFEFAVRGIKAVFSTAFLPIIKIVSEATAAFSRELQQLNRERNILQVGFASLAFVGLRALFFNFTRIGKIVAKIGFGRLIKRLGGMRAIITRLLPLVGRLLKGLLRFALPVLIFDDLVTTIQGGDSLLRRFLETTLGVQGATEIIQTFQNAWEILTTTIALAWNIITGGSEETRQKLEADFMRLTEGLAQFFEKDIPEFAAFLWADLKAGVADLWEFITAQFTAGVAWIQRKISEIPAIGGTVSEILGLGSGGSPAPTATSPGSPRTPVAPGGARTVTVRDQSQTTINVGNSNVARGVERAVSRQQSVNRTAILAGVGG